MSKVKIQNNAIIHNDGSANRSTLTFDYDTSAFPSESVTSISANIIPTLDNTFQLGTGSKRWSHIFQTGGSVYMGDDGLLTVSKGKMVIRNRKDGNLFPPPLWHQKHALFKYGIQTNVQQDPISRKTRNYLGQSFLNAEHVFVYVGMAVVVHAIFSHISCSAVPYNSFVRLRCYLMYIKPNLILDPQCTSYF